MRSHRNIRWTSTVACVRHIPIHWQIPPQDSLQHHVTRHYSNSVHQRSVCCPCFSPLYPVGGQKRCLFLRAWLLAPSPVGLIFYSISIKSVCYLPLALGLVLYSILELFATFCNKVSIYTRIVITPQPSHFYRYARQDTTRCVLSERSDLPRLDTSPRLPVKSITPVHYDVFQMRALIFERRWAENVSISTRMIISPLPSDF